MSRSSSKSSANQTTSNVSNQLSFDGIDGVALAGDNNNLNVSDQDAIDSAFEYAAGVTQASYAENKDARDALLTVTGGTINRAFDAVDNNVDNVFELTGGVVSEMSKTNAAAISEISKSQAEALDKSLSFASGAFIEAQSSINAALKSVERQQTEANTLATNSLNKIAESADNALQFGAGAIDAVIDNADASQELLTKFATQTINTAVQSTKSESAQALDKIIGLTADAQKNILYAAGAVLALFVVMRRA